MFSPSVRPSPPAVHTPPIPPPPLSAHFSLNPASRRTFAPHLSPRSRRSPTTPLLSHLIFPSLHHLSLPPALFMPAPPTIPRPHASIPLNTDSFAPLSPHTSRLFIRPLLWRTFHIPVSSQPPAQFSPTLFRSSITPCIHPTRPTPYVLPHTRAVAVASPLHSDLSPYCASPLLALTPLTPPSLSLPLHRPYHLLHISNPPSPTPARPLSPSPFPSFNSLPATLDVTERVLSS